MKFTSIEAVARSLNDAGVRYLVVGGLAVAAHGYARTTFDVDLVIQLRPDNVVRAMEALEALGYRPLVPVKLADFADARIRESWIQDKRMVVFQLRSDQHRETSLDVFVSEPFDFDLEYDQALRGDILPGVTVRFVSLETLIQMKQVADRPKDQEDIRQLKLLSGKANDVE